MKSVNRKLLWLAVLFSCLALPVHGETPAEEGLAIALEADRRESGFGDYQADMAMILKNRHGQESRRQMRIRTLEIEGDGNRSLLVFETPRDVKGTALLTFTHKEEDDDQWLYLPALKRVKRISSRNKSGSFMGSEFAYEDIASPEVEKYTYQWLRDEEYGGRDCFVLERVPRDLGNSGYTRQVSWLDKEEYRVLKVEYYDRKNVLLKTLTISGYLKYLDKYWYPAAMAMVNHQSGKSTTLTWSDYRFQTGLTGHDFNKNSLMRAR